MIIVHKNTREKGNVVFVLPWGVCATAPYMADVMARPREMLRRREVCRMPAPREDCVGGRWEDV
tara:strand:+ start:808 stop:999 length:192 start_codon:yes stop_codon:yes gene_type:complete